MDPYPGLVLRDNLRLVRPLGKGAMGAVWVAHHEGLGTEVAVKFVHADLMREDPRALERFRREANAVARIRSTHVVQVFDKGVTRDGLPFIVMELLAGESLADRIHRAGPLSVRDTCEMVAQVARALDKAHKVDIIHRDIKPENIFLVDDEGSVFAKVLDFGIAKHSRWEGSGKLTNPEHLVGTPAYMSRDRILDARPIDRFADLWSLAVVAYESLTGRLPFDGATMAEICVAICKGGHLPPSELRPSLEPRLDAFFERAFHESAEMRFASARELAVELLMAGSGGSAAVADIREAFQGSGKFRLPASVRLPGVSHSTLDGVSPPRPPSFHDSGTTKLPSSDTTGPDLVAPATVRMDESSPTLLMPDATARSGNLPSPAASSQATLSGATSLSRGVVFGPRRWPAAAVGSVVVSLTVALVLAAILLLRAEPDPEPAAGPSVESDETAAVPLGISSEEPVTARPEQTELVEPPQTPSAAVASVSASANGAPPPRKPTRRRPPPAPQRPEDVLGF